MTTPLPPEIVLPSGRPAYLNPYSGTYSTSRSYARRMQRNYARNITQGEARGHRVSPAGLSESQQRRQRQLNLTGQTPWQAFTQSFEVRYGISYRYWRKLRRRWINQINEMSSPDLQITPVWIQQELANSQISGHGPEWIEEHLAEKLYAMGQYREGNPVPGMTYFSARDSMSSVEWWYYH